MAYADRDTLFIFLDESGNLDFSPKGTRYWSLTAFCTFQPRGGKGAFFDLLYTLADEGKGQECFHASEDKQDVRDRVFALINGLQDSHEIHSVIAEKQKTNPVLYRRAAKSGKNKTGKDESRFYGIVCKSLLKYAFQCPRFSSAKKIVVILSSIFTKEKHDFIRGTLIAELKSLTKASFHIYFHQTKSEFNCQIADYCGWAIWRKWESQDRRSYDLISNKIRNEFEIFAKGTKLYY
jgi:hypothetical protein